jgi:hypothetical protein
MRKIIVGVLTAAIALFIALPASAAPSLVRNGGFERPDVEGDFETFFAGDTIEDEDEWVVDFGSVDVVSEPRFDVRVGDQAIDLNGEERGSISQTLETVEDEDYLLRFYLAGNPECDDGVKRLRVFWDDRLVAVFFYDPGTQEADDLDWELRTLELRATGDETELRFASGNDGACGPMIDAVRVVDTPDE